MSALTAMLNVAVQPLTEHCKETPRYKAYCEGMELHVRYSNQQLLRSACADRREIRTETETGRKPA